MLPAEARLSAPQTIRAFVPNRIYSTDVEATLYKMPANHLHKSI
jgi:hypothetical protein